MTGQSLAAPSAGAGDAAGTTVAEIGRRVWPRAGEYDPGRAGRLAAVTAGCVAATGGLAKIVGEEEFPIHFHQGERDNLHMTLVGDRMILVVVFDERSSLGLVRLRVKKAGNELGKLFEEIRKKAETEVRSNGSPFAEITDDDIDNLFSD